MSKAPLLTKCSIHGSAGMSRGILKKFFLQITDSIAKLNSTPIWNSILQIFFLSTVEFNLSELSVKIL